MINDDHDDDLDRALFALPLAEPPAGLRESILRATIDAPVPAPSPLGRAETIAIGIVLALATWLAIVVVRDRSFVAEIASLAGGVATGLTDVRTLLWLGLGAFVAVSASLANVSFGFPSVRGRTT
jgi:hypothetical protein